MEHPRRGRAGDQHGEVLAVRARVHLRHQVIERGPTEPTHHEDRDAHRDPSVDIAKRAGRRRISRITIIAAGPSTLPNRRRSSSVLRYDSGAGGRIACAGGIRAIRHAPPTAR